ncbi:Ppp1r37 [Columba livia]|nr:Ppp1r37 [Columba livia]
MEAPGPAVAPSEPGNEAPPPAEASPPPGASGGAEDGRLRPGAKRVTFPSDEDIVSGAVEPKDPWRHAQNVTVEEIVTAYKLACQKLSCRQIPKLLKQIEELKDLAPRIECLDLKGEKLDYKACEALEEVFKRVQFKIVDLEQTNLDEDGASALFDMIEYYESATHLNISCNKHIGTRGWQAAAHMMRKTSCLQYLDARNTPLLDHSAPFVARALRISSSLAVLHLESTSLSGRPLMLLATALKMNVNLRELYLADNKLNGLQDSAQLGNLLKFNCYIQILDLRNNHILDSGLAYLCEGLKEQQKGLVTLVLWNNQLTHTGMAYLGMTLPHTQSLETLNLGHNPIGNEGVRNLKNGLIGNRSVLRLGLASTKLTCEGAVAVAEFIAESPRLLRLDLRENEIKTGGLMALSLALKVNHSLLRLDLDREPKKEAVKSFLETQKALLAEIQNGCKRNFVLAREREEQQLQHSASMPEITHEDKDEGPTEATAEGTEPAANGDSDNGDNDGDNDGDNGTDSDSDTDDEADAVVAKDSSEAAERTDVTAPGPPRERPCPLPVAEQGGPASPQCAERRISVSSPGRGHKIFVVTRVETLPEPPNPETPANGAPRVPLRPPSTQRPQAGFRAGRCRTPTAKPGAAPRSTS